MKDHGLGEMRDDSLRAVDDFAVFLSSMHVLLNSYNSTLRFAFRSKQQDLSDGSHRLSLSPRWLLLVCRVK